MTRDELFAVVRDNILSVHSGLTEDDVRAGRSMRELGLNSLDRMDVVVGVLDQLGLELRADRFGGVEDIGGLVDALAQQLRAEP